MSPVGTQLVARHSCSVSVLSASTQSSHSLNRNVVEKHLPQCSSSVLFHILRPCRCSTNTLNFSVLLPSSQAAADFQLQVSGALGFSQMRFLNQVVPPGATSTWNSLGRHSEEKAMVTHSSTLAWKIPRTEEPGRLQSMGSQRAGHGGATSLSLFTFMHWRRKWQPTPVFLPGEPRDGRAWGAAVYGVAHSWTRLK